MKKYMLFDTIYITNPNDAICYEVCDSLKEARQSKKDYNVSLVIVEGVRQDNKMIEMKIVDSELRL